MKPGPNRFYLRRGPFLPHVHAAKRASSGDPDSVRAQTHTHAVMESSEAENDLMETSPVKLPQIHARKGLEA